MVRKNRTMACTMFEYKKESRAWFGVLAAVMIIQFVSFAAGAFVQIETSPNIVQTKAANLIIGLDLAVAVEKGGWLEIDFPEAMRVESSAGNCREESDLLSFACTVDTEANRLRFAALRAITPGQSYQILVDKAVTLPDTNITVDPIRMTTSANEIRDGTFRAAPGTLGAVTLTPASQVAAAGTELMVSVTTRGVIPKNGKIHIVAGEYWNEGATDSKLEYFSSIGCDNFVIGGQSNRLSEYQCQWLDGNRAEIEGGLMAERPTPAGTKITWKITGFRNPIAPHDEFRVFTVYTSAAEVDRMVDQVLVAISVEKPAQLMAASFVVSPTQTTEQGIVQEVNTMDLRYATPTPFRPNCIVEYWFPAAFYDADEVTRVTTGDLFAGRKRYYKKGAEPSRTTFAVTPEEGGTYKALRFRSCDTFRSQSRSESTRIEGLRQPKSTERTSSLRIYIIDVEEHAVAQLEEGLTFQPTKGTITFNTASMKPTTVLISTAITLSFVPTHGLPATMKPRVQIAFPVDYVVQEACEVTPVTGLGEEPGCATDQVHNAVTVGTEMTKDLAGKEELSFTVHNIRVPGTIGGGAANIEITTLLQALDGSYHEVDSTAVGARDYLRPTPGALIAKVTTESDQAYARTAYTITIRPEHQVPQYGIITVKYPPDVRIEDPSLSQTQCKDWKNFPSNQGHCSIDSEQIIVYKGFQQGAGGPGPSAEYSWTVPAVTSPASLLETSSFEIQTRDQFNDKIDEVLVGVTVEMSRPAEFKRAELILRSHQNAVRTRYLFRIVATNPLKNGNIIMLTFPEETELPDSDGAYACSSNTKVYIRSLACSTAPAKPRTVKMVPTLQRTIPPLETFEIEVSGILNPASTKPAGNVEIIVYSDSS